MNENGLPSTEGEVKLDPDTFCPFQIFDIRLKLFYEAQHDGPEFTDVYKVKLIQEIMDDIKIQVEQFVRKLNPLGIPRS